MLTVSLAGCGDDGDDGDAAPDLTGRSFVATTVEGHDLVSDTSITITFEDDLIVIAGGCNSMRGGYSIADGTLQVDTLASTSMACDEALMDQDFWLGEFFESGPTVEDGETLVLSADTVRIVLEEEA